MPSIAVRPFRPDDAHDLGVTYYQLYDERDAGEPVGITLFTQRPSSEDERAWYEKQYARAQAGELIFLVAEVDGRVVGNCLIDRHGPSDLSEEAHVGELGILVRRDARGQGVGTALLERALEAARRRFDVVYLSVFAFNTRAQRLYERFGFVECGRLPRMLKRGGRFFDQVRMVLLFDPDPSGQGPTVKHP